MKAVSIIALICAVLVLSTPVVSAKRTTITSAWSGLAGSFFGKLRGEPLKPNVRWHNAPYLQQAPA
jgi:hypothetical protein